MSIPLISDLVQVNSNITLKQSSAGSNFITFQGPATVTGYTLTFPAAQAGGSNYTLVNDGAGNLTPSNT
jgi:hypothetical protein